jgi:hypothetical protein
VVADAAASSLDCGATLVCVVIVGRTKVFVAPLLGIARAPTALTTGRIKFRS